MPRVIATDADEAIDLADLVEMLEAGDFDSRDEDNFASWGAALKKLANNRAFLSDIALAELKARCRNQTRDNQYSSQVIMLHNGSSKFAMRANIWPAMNDSVVRSSGTNPFFYGYPHDHNFSFLTVGYLGPGYWSEYYEYDYDTVAGHEGEPVDLRYIEKSRLEQGKVMLYRAHKDVHNQLAADTTSVSINILGNNRTNPFQDQYSFDVENKRIGRIINNVAIEPMLALAAHFGGGNGADLLASFAKTHPSDRIRFLAVKAQAAAAGDLDDRIALMDRATADTNPYVSAMAGLQLQKLERGRAWLSGSGLQPAA